MNHAASNDGNNSPDNNDDDNNNSNHPYNRRPSVPLVPPLRYAATGGITLPMGVALQLHHHAQTITTATSPPPTAATTTVQAQTIVANHTQTTVPNTATQPQPVGRIPIHGHGGESVVGIDNIDPAAVQQQQLQHQLFEVAHPLPQLEHSTTATPTALALALAPPPVVNVGPIPTANDDDILQREAVATATATVVDVGQMHHVDCQPPQNHGQQQQEQQRQQHNYHEHLILHPQNYQQQPLQLQQYPLQLQLVPPRPLIPPPPEVAAALPLPMNTIPQQLPIVHIHATKTAAAAADAAGFTANAASSPHDQEEGEEHRNMEEEEEEVWQCHKCQRDNLASKVRCSSCQCELLSYSEYMNIHSLLAWCMVWVW